MMETLDYQREIAGAVAYEERYDLTLRFFQKIAEAPNETYEVPFVTAEWIPLLRYLGAGKQDPTRYTLRGKVEEACAAEPVLVDALWRADMKWSGERRHLTEKVFTISTYSGFWRPEILKFMNLVDGYYSPQKPYAVVMPCSATKPYPTPAMIAVKKILGDEYEMLIASSAIGIAPESMWADMPLYDAGLPFFERLRERAEFFFGNNLYKRVINYTDMTQPDTDRALSASGALYFTPLRFPTVHTNLGTLRSDYQPLGSGEMLKKFAEAVEARYGKR